MVKVAKYINANDRPLYNYYSDLQKRHQEDLTKVKLSETEAESNNKLKKHSVDNHFKLISRKF